MKKIIIILMVLVAMVGLFFWLRYDINQAMYIEKIQGDLKTLENEKHNLKIDNESLERDKKSMKNELEIYRECPSGDCKG